MEAPKNKLNDCGRNVCEHATWWDCSLSAPRASSMMESHRLNSDIDERMLYRGFHMPQRMPMPEIIIFVRPGVMQARLSARATARQQSIFSVKRSLYCWLLIWDINCFLWFSINISLKAASLSWLWLHRATSFQCRQLTHASRIFSRRATSALEAYWTASRRELGEAQRRRALQIIIAAERFIEENKHLFASREKRKCWHLKMINTHMPQWAWADIYDRAIPFREQCTAAWASYFETAFYLLFVTMICLFCCHVLYWLFIEFHCRAY